jgi:hypothetical protein
LSACDTTQLAPKKNGRTGVGNRRGPSGNGEISEF